MKYTKHLITAVLAAFLLVSCGTTAADDSTETTIDEHAYITESHRAPVNETSIVPETTVNDVTETTVDHVWGTAQSWTELKPPQSDFDYSTLTLPDYRAQNPVRYHGVDDRGMKTDGWQNFGTAGEIRTIPVPMGATYTYQTYSYFIRNDLTHLYPNDSLPSDPEYLSKWLADISAVGRRALWYSAGADLPQSIDLTAYEELTSGDGTRIGKATYLADGRKWVVYLLCEESTASAFAIRTNEDGDYVIDFTDTIANSYRLKATE